MRSPFSRSAVMGLALLAGSPVLTAFPLSLSDSDFTNTTVFSSLLRDTAQKSKFLAVETPEDLDKCPFR